MELRRSEYDERHFGNAEAIFRVGRLFVRVVRDRGQDFVDVASGNEPDKFFQFDDIDIAMGWRTLDEVLAKREPGDLTFVLGRLASRFSALEEALTGDQTCYTSGRIERVAKMRRDAFVKKLRR